MTVNLKKLATEMVNLCNEGKEVEKAGNSNLTVEFNHFTKEKVDS